MKVEPSSPVFGRSLLSEGDFAQLVAVVEAQLNDAIVAFERRDLALAEKVMRTDEKADALSRRIDQRAIALLEAGGLAGRAFRHAVTLIKLAIELERVGDLAKNVARRTRLIAASPAPAASPGVVRMGRASLRQFSDVLDAVRSDNLAAAAAVWSGDDNLDELYASLYRDLVSAMSADPAQVEAGAHLLFIVKNFERIGDHATNIAEAFHYLETGAAIEQDRPKGGQAASPENSADNPSPRQESR